MIDQYFTHYCLYIFMMMICLLILLSLRNNEIKQLNKYQVN